jgi:hypothetical protein
VLKAAVIASLAMALMMLTSHRKLTPQVEGNPDPADAPRAAGSVPLPPTLVASRMKVPASHDPSGITQRRTTLWPPSTNAHAAPDQALDRHLVLAQLSDGYAAILLKTLFARSSAAPSRKS